jgi:ABC-2 type transport system ATP-binding protein
VIQVRNLTKRFGTTVAVDDLSFDVQSGRVTGFLGPNGSGKSTTMRCMVGLDRFEGGSTSFAGRSFSELATPLHEVGILLDAGYVHPARSGRNHLRWLAVSNGIPTSRVDEVLQLVGMTDAADKKLRSYSLGMKQRLGIASTLLGDPATMILDEPANGLDPEGIRWIRDFLRHYADQGRTVLVSSHLLSEMSLMAQDLIVIGKGRLIQQSSVAEFVSRHASTWVRVRSPQLPSLLDAVNAAGATVKLIGDAAAPAGADVRGLTIEQIGEAAAHAGVTLHELSAQTESLEDAFLSATAETQEYRSGGDS